jgi:hypothetical protein
MTTSNLPAGTAQGSADMASAGMASLVIPANVGSPWLPVVAAVPSPSDPKTLYCVVQHVPGRSDRYGVVRAYQGSTCACGTGCDSPHCPRSWAAFGGSYDKTLPQAIESMIKRAGWGE